MIQATAPELAVYNVLVKLIGIENFTFQSAFLGGRQSPGGVIGDFYIPSLALIISILGIYWHYQKPERMAQDEAQNLALSAQGIKTIYIDEEDAMRNAVYYVQEALEFNDHSKLTRG